MKAFPDPEQYRMPLLEHLRELRNRLMIAIGALTIGSMIGLVFTEDVFHFLRAPIQSLYHPEPVNRWDYFYLWLTTPIRPALPVVHIEGALTLVNSPLEGMYSFFQIGLIFGAVITSPIIALQIWQFVAPGLLPAERRVVIPLTVASTLLFLAGALFCYAVILPFSLPYMLTILDVKADTSLSGYLGFVVRMMIGLGLCFQMPVITWFLARFGLIDHRDLLKFFRYAVVALFIISAIVTPDTNPITQILMVIPLLVLYGIGIVVAWIWSTKVRPTETPS